MTLLTVLYFKCLVCLLILCHLYSEGLNIDYLGVSYKKIMYYISTNPKTEVVMHYLDQGNKNRIIEDSQIPNQHLLIGDTISLQGTFELIVYSLKHAMVQSVCNYFFPISEFSYFVIIFSNHILFVINFSYFIIRFYYRAIK